MFATLQAVVVDEVDNFLFRPHLVLRAKYHGVCFYALSWMFLMIDFVQSFIFC